MSEIRAQGISESVKQRYEEIKEYLGATTDASAMATMVNILHLQLCSSRRVDLFKKAAKLVSAQENFRREMHPSEIQQVLIKDGLVCVWARHQGEPYKLPEKTWNEN